MLKRRAILSLQQTQCRFSFGTYCTSIFPPPPKAQKRANKRIFAHPEQRTWQWTVADSKQRENRQNIRTNFFFQQIVRTEIICQLIALGMSAKRRWVHWHNSFISKWLCKLWEPTTFWLTTTWRSVSGLSFVAAMFAPRCFFGFLENSTAFDTMKDLNTPS